MLYQRDDRYIKTKIGACGENVYTKFRGLNVTEDDINCESLQPFPLIHYL